MLKVTVSILCYNYGQYLPRAIESCIHQEKGNYTLQILVIDDGSTDNTPEICERYQPYINCYRSRNEGFASSLTKAVRLADGDIVCLLDADDYFLPNKINAIVEVFTKDPSLLFLYHDKICVDEHDQVSAAYVKGGSTSTQVFNKNAAMDLLPACNEQFFYTLYLAGRGMHLKKSLSFYRLHNDNMSHQKKLRDWKRQLLQMNIFHLARIKDLIERPPYWGSKKVMKSIYCRIASNYNYLRTEIALNEQNHSFALKCYFKILCWDIRSGHFSLNNLKLGISYFILRRYIRYSHIKKNLS